MPIRVNRTIDTRIFSSSESPVRYGKAEEAKRVSAGTTEPPCPTEPIPNPEGRRRPSSAVSSRNARAPAHRDRAATESEAAQSCRANGAARQQVYSDQPKKQACTSSATSEANSSIEFTSGLGS
jgi:hypothetical protein